MKKFHLISAAAIFLLASLTACETPLSTADRALLGQKCSQCACKGYVPGRIMQGYCSYCGHTAEEHGGGAK